MFDIQAYNLEIIFVETVRPVSRQIFLKHEMASDSIFCVEDCLFSTEFPWLLGKDQLAVFVQISLRALRP